MTGIMASAIEKIRKEEKGLKPKGKIQSVIKRDVANILQAFCQGDERFAREVMEGDGTLEGCLDHISKQVTGDGASDLTVYKLAAEYYIPGAEVDFIMEIRTDGIGHATDFDGRRLREAEGMKKTEETARKETPERVEETVSAHEVDERDVLTIDGKRKARTKKKAVEKADVMQFGMFDMLDMQEKKANQ